METPKKEASSWQDKNKRRGARFLLILLLLLALFSSVIVGFMIGRDQSVGRGQIIDTIVIGPDANRTVHVTGQIRYTDGTPFTSGRVELRSEPRVTSTDGRGRFFYPGVAPGAHTLTVMDESGKTLAACEISINRNTGDFPLDIRKQADQKYAVELSVNVRLIELAVELDAGRALLRIIPEKTTVLEDSGLVTENGKKLRTADGLVVLPSGTVIMPDLTVVAPGHLILPDNSVTPIPQDGYTGANDEKVRPDGSVALPSGVWITPDGIILPDGTVILPEEIYQIDTEPRQNASTSSGAHPPVSPVSSDRTTSVQEPVSSRNDTASSGTGQSSAPSPVSSEPEDHGTFGVQGQNKAGWTSWDSQSTIDLFYNRTGSAKNGAIQPGSKGYYLFRLENSRKTALSCTITMTEQSFHLPMKIRLVGPDGKPSAWQTLQKGQPLSLYQGDIGGEALFFRLEWEWPYDSGDDGADTAAGAGKGHDYLVGLQIHAE